MANLKNSPKFEIHDDYYTPKKAWENIAHLIPKDKVIFEACMKGSNLSKSPYYLKELGFEVVFDTEHNILEEFNKPFDIIISNPPFETEIKKKILKRLVEIDKPFIIIMNSMNTFTKYFREIFKGNFEELQIITPSNKINFDKMNIENGVETLTPTKNCSFYCIYLAYKMNLKTEELWL